MSILDLQDLAELGIVKLFDLVAECTVSELETKCIKGNLESKVCI